MGEKDKAEKQLEAYNDVFADIVNGILFQGCTCVKPEDLQEVDPNSAYRVDGVLRGQERDVAKLWKEDGLICMAIFGVENQTAPDRDMPVRVMGYDFATYRHQIEHEEGRFPVLTFVLYFGYETRWNTAKSLKKWFDRKCLRSLKPEERKHVRKYIPDYRIHVFEAAWLECEQLDLFHGDFRIILDYFNQMRKDRSYQPSKTVIDHVRAFLDLLSALTGDQRFNEIYPDIAKKGGQVTMCTVIDQYIEKGVDKRTVEILVNVMQQRQITYDEAVDLLCLSDSDRKQYRSAVEEAMRETVQS